MTTPGTASAASKRDEVLLTVNATCAKGFEIRTLIANVSKSNLSHTVKRLSQNAEYSALPAEFNHFNVLSVGAAQAVQAPFSKFHALRFSIAQCAAILLNNPSKMANVDEKAQLLNQLIVYALSQPNDMSIIADMLFDVPLPNVDKIAEFLEKTVKLSTGEVILVALSLTFAVQEPCCNIGRKLLEMKTDIVKDFGKLGLSETQLASLKQALFCDDSLCKSINTSPNSVLKKLRDSIQIEEIAAPSMKDALAVVVDSFSLAGLIEELGLGCVATHNDCVDMLDLAPVVTPKLVAETIGLLSCPSVFTSKESNAYNSLRCSLQIAKGRAGSTGSAAPTSDKLGELLAIFVGAVKEKAAKLDWTEVLSALDHPNINIDSFDNIAQVYKTATATNAFIPAEIFFGRWKNAKVQSKALAYIANNPSMVQLPVPLKKSRKQIPENIPSKLDSAVWRHIEFYEAICHVSARERDIQDCVSDVIPKAPSLLLTGFIACRPQGSLRHLTFALQVLRQSGPAAVNDAVISYFRSESQLSSPISLLGELVISEPSKFVETIEVVTKMQLVTQILSTHGVLKFIVGVAIAGKETKQTPDKWLEDRLTTPKGTGTNIKSPGNRFSIAAAAVEVCEEFLNRQVFVGASTAALRLLIANSEEQVMPAVVAHAKILLESGDSSFPTEIETEALRMFEQFIRSSTNTPGLTPIEICEKLHNSTQSEDKQLFACIVNTLFEDSKATSQYPWSSLISAARLFGQLISKNLLSPQRVSSGLQFILNALNNTTDMRVQEFGIMALECFYQRIPEWPHYGKQLQAIEHLYLDMRIPGIMVLIRNSMKKRKQEGVASDDKKADETAAVDLDKPDTTKGLHQHDIRSLMSDVKHQAPPQILQDQINFLVGNTDPGNLTKNAEELKKILLPEYFDFFAEYFVVKRVSLEANHHEMYLHFLETIGNEDLDIAIRKATVFAVKRILNSEKIRTDASERSLLKALGGWYGKITLAKNIPINANEINFRKMIFSGLEEGKLIAIVPFITKVLDNCVPPSIFEPPNPWTMGQFALLNDVSNLQDVKITLRFEVEVLAKNTRISLEKVDVFCHDHPPPYRPSLSEIRATMDISDNPDFRPPDPRQSSPGPNKACTTGTPVSRLTADAAPYQPRGADAAPEPVQVPPRLELTAALVVITKDAAFLKPEHLDHYRTTLKTILNKALECVQSQVTRAVLVAIYATRELVVKDFTRDSDCNAMLRAAVAMVRSLAANLCVGTREALQKQFDKFIKVVANHVVKDDEVKQNELEKYVFENNFNLLVRCMESSAACDAEKDLRDQLGTLITKKQELNARGEAATTADQQTHRELISQLPNFLRDPNIVLPQQRRVYEDFFHMTPTTQLLLSRVQDMAVKYEKISLDIKADDVLARFNEMRALVAPDTAPIIEPLVFNRVIAISDKLCDVTGKEHHRLEDNRPRHLREIFLQVLQYCKEVNPKFNVTKLLLDDERRWKFHELAVHMVRRKILDCETLDVPLAADLKPKNQATHFATQLLDKVVLQEKLTSAKVLTKTFEALDKIANVDPVHPSCVTTIRVHSMYAGTDKHLKRDKISEHLNNWVKMCEERHNNRIKPSSDSEKKKSMDFMGLLEREGMLKSIDGGHLDCLLGTMMELCLEDYLTITWMHERRGRMQAHHRTPLSEAVLYAKVDGYTDLIALLIRCCSSGQSNESQVPPEVALISKILQVVTRIIHSNHANCQQKRDKFPPLENHEAYQKHFVQQPYVRFLSNLLLITLFRVDNSSNSIINDTVDGSPPSLTDEIIASFLNTLSELEPNKVPAFAFGWLELLCHRLLTARALGGGPKKGPVAPPRRQWDKYASLLVAGLQFIDPFTKGGEGIKKSTLNFCRGYLKLLLVILHDFGTFIMHYHHLLCDHIPVCCIQMRNVVLCSFPPDLNLPDPFQESFTPQIPKTAKPPTIPLRYQDAICVVPSQGADEPNITIKETLLRSMAKGMAPAKLCDMMRGPVIGAPRWSIPVISSTVLFLGIEHLKMVQAPQYDGPLVATDHPMFKIFIVLCNGMDSEGRFYLMNSIVNQLRYPNTHTYFFASLTLLLFRTEPALFGERGQNTLDCTKEQIIRVLAERLVGSRPHPWGVLVTYNELLRKKEYGYWRDGRPAIPCSPDVEKALIKLAEPFEQKL